MLLKNKSAIITGCNKGIGKEILEIFSENGANIFACVRKIDENLTNFIEKIKAKHRNKVVLIECDFSNEESVKDAANEILDSKERIPYIITDTMPVKPVTIDIKFRIDLTRESSIKATIRIKFYKKPELRTLP